MRSSSTPSATSLATAPEDDARARSRKYYITMGVRMVCLVLMATVTPYSWYTWVFALGAAVLPYVAVVVANAGSAPTARRAVDPRRAVEAPPGAPRAAEPDDPGVFRINESPRSEDS
ncbi:DUF3099 domain-containing protein [Microbacterium dauci]|uniref:DUF3099 domain-containing protein n=1 Tax=Microbacterium dauci TaxID=3048008 RepID=A0ABT6ZGE0_9MICO|nr:DUF3099 domain-containing protein [Microbacterium sp. LX3-4]MDJ1115222.1 DUF3099 domain-containing protein [Microbacterium sp. LX3-4]